MSWDIVLFNSKQKIESVADIDENQLEPVNFSKLLEDYFEEIVKNENHREIRGVDFSIEFFYDEEPVSNMMINIYGESGLFEIIELAKKHGWQIYDTGLDDMLDLNDPEKNGYMNFRNYVEKIMKSR